MRYLTIPATDLSVFEICMGSTGIGSTIDRERSFRLLDLYAEAGGNVVRFRGRMLEAPVMARYTRILSLKEMINA